VQCACAIFAHFDNLHDYIVMTLPNKTLFNFLFHISFLRRVFFFGVYLREKRCANGKCIMEWIHSTKKGFWTCFLWEKFWCKASQVELCFWKSRSLVTWKSLDEKLNKTNNAQFMFLPIKSYKTWEKAIKNFRLSRVVAANDRNVCPTYSLYHKT
jgi:hypothetical protein